MSSYAVSQTTQNTENQSYSFENLMGGNVNAGGNATINGLYGEDMQAFVKSVSGITQQAVDSANAALNKVASLADKATASNSSLSGSAIEAVAKGYQSAYSETTGMLQQLKPVLLFGLGVFVLVYGKKFIKGL